MILIIPYKSLSGEVTHFQVRRIRCVHCERFYSYLAYGDCKEETTGIPMVDTDEAMADRSLQGMNYSLTRLAKAARRGKAMCPHCKSFQPWMIRSIVSIWLTYAALTAFIVAFATPFIVSWERIPELAEYLRTVTWSLPAALILSFIAAWLSSPSIGPHPEKNEPLSKSDDELEHLLADYAERDDDPFEKWLRDIEVEPKYPLFNLGFWDQTDHPLNVPDALKTESIAKTIDPY